MMRTRGSAPSPRAPPLRCGMTRPTHARLLLAVLLAASPWIAAAAATAAPDPNQDILELEGQGKYAEAVALGRERLAAVEARTGAESTDTAAVLDALVLPLVRLGKGAEAETRALAERALRIREAHPETRPEDLALTVTRLALVLDASGDLRGALALHERALALREALGPDHPELGKILVNIGILHARLGEYPAARTFLERALEISRRTLPPGDPNLGFSLVNLGNLDSLLGDHETALARQEEALRLWTAAWGAEHPHAVSALVSVGSSLSQLGDYAGAIEKYRQAIPLQRKTLGDTNPAVARTLTSYAELLRITGQHDEALRLLEEAIAIYSSASGPDTPELKSPLVNLAALRFDRHEYAACAASLEKARAVVENKHGPDHPELQLVYENLAQVRLRMGDIEGARAALQRSRELADKHLPPDHPSRGRLDIFEGTALATEGDFTGARAAMQRGLSALVQSLGPWHQTVVDARARLARVAWTMGDRALALEQAGAAAVAQERGLRETMEVFPEARALRLASWRALPERVLFAGLLGDPERRDAWLATAWDWSLGSRGLVLEEISARRVVADLGGAPEAREALARLTRASNRLAAVWVKGAGPASPGTFEADLEAARRERESAEAALAEASRRYRRLSGFAPVDRHAVAGALPEDGVLIEVTVVSTRFKPVGDEVDPATLRYMALRLDRDGRMDYADLGAASEIDDLVRRWRAALGGAAPGSAKAASREAGWRDAGGALARVVWDPVARLAGGARRVFLVPDGALYQVYFPALPRPGGRFLIETGPSVHLLSTGRDLARLHAAAAVGAGSTLLALGGVPFGRKGAPLDVRGVSSCEPVNRRAWAPLPESRREVALVAGLFGDRGPNLALTGADASESRLKREVPGRGVLHLATHGYFLDEACDPGAPNPLLLSGLVLASDTVAPAGAGGEDGVLTAQEVAALDLSGVGLTVLSACDTGLGQVTAGEGIFGLRRALEVAGSRSMVMSLWPVADRPARHWMTTFYEAWLAGRPVDDAAAGASRALLADLRRRDEPPHPYLWGGFVTAGDWRPPASSPAGAAGDQGQRTSSQ